jgi:hypothetical protein
LELRSVITELKNSLSWFSHRYDQIKESNIQLRLESFQSERQKQKRMKNNEESI